jgi:hypothetical protein
MPVTTYHVIRLDPSDHLHRFVKLADLRAFVEELERAGFEPDYAINIDFAKSGAAGAQPFEVRVVMVEETNAALSRRRLATSEPAR